VPAFSSHLKELGVACWQGKEPVSWRTLIEVLHDTGLHVLEMTLELSVELCVGSHIN